jgi:hypothetical protein
MIAFNLERALAGEPVCTRDGRDVTQLVRFEVKERELIYGVLDGHVRTWYTNGNFLVYSISCNDDLFMKPKENAIWVNVYKDNGTGELILGCAFKSEAQAKMVSTELKHSKYIRTIKITE